MTTTDDKLDRLLRLLPQVVQDSDAFAGRPLQALLRVLGEQMNVVEADILGLLENWFVETCDEWALPYIGELVGVRPLGANAPPPTDDSPRSLAHARAVYPRREYARSVAHRRRKGALLLLQELARDVAGWPARAVEFRHLMRASWSPRDGRVAVRGPALRNADQFDRGSGPFDGLPRRPDLRRLASPLRRGRGSVASVGLWVWRLSPHQVREGEARKVEGHACPTFDRFLLSPFGVDQPLFVWPRPLPDPTGPAGESEVPGPLRRTALRDDVKCGAGRYYGRDASLYLWRMPEPKCEEHKPNPQQQPEPPEEITSDKVAVADLSHWDRLSGWLWEGKVAVVDPHTGRVMIRRNDRGYVLFARYHTARPADLGGGGYFREPLPGLPGAVRKRVAGPPMPAPGGAAQPPADFETLAAALAAWDAAAFPRNWVIEIDDDRTHEIGPERCVDPAETKLSLGESLVIRAAVGRRPVVRHRHSGKQKAIWKVTGGSAAGFTLDGLAVVDLPLRVSGSFAQVRIRHSTLFGNHALTLDHLDGCISIENAIVVGGVASEPVDATPHPPPRVLVADSILAGRHPRRPHCLDHPPPADIPSVWILWGLLVAGDEADRSHRPSVWGYADVTARRCTFFGAVGVSAIDLAEDCIFEGVVRATNTERGCIRYSSLAGVNPAADPTTPPRYACQPDLALAPLMAVRPPATDNAYPSWLAGVGVAAGKVAPRFRSRAFGDPTFAQLADSCPPEIRRGGTGGSEMGAFHDQFFPHREALLAARLEEFTPAGADVRLLFAT